MTILWFEMSGFSEAFFRDAELVSQFLEKPIEIRTTKGAGVIPVVRFSVSAAKSHFGELLAAGYDLAVCEDIKLPGRPARTIIRKWKGGDA